MKDFQLKLCSNISTWMKRKLYRLNEWKRFYYKFSTMPSKAKISSKNKFYETVISRFIWFYSCLGALCMALVADLRGAPSGVQILSISCSFWENLAKSHVGAYPPSPEPRGLVPQPRGNPRSATGRAQVRFASLYGRMAIRRQNSYLEKSVEW